MKRTNANRKVAAGNARLNHEGLRRRFQWLTHRGVRGLFVLACLSLLGDEVSGEQIAFTVDHARSYIAVKTDKGGLLSAFGAGHKHGIVATDWSAAICFDPKNVSLSRVAITVSTASLRIDTPEGRKKARLDPKGPSTDDVQKIQEKMLAPQNLAAEEHPNIGFRSTSVEFSDQRSFQVQGTLTVRGKPQTVSIPVSFESLNDQQYHFSGHFPVKQSSYGITPESIGGVVNVEDEVQIYFDIYAGPTAKTCN